MIWWLLSFIFFLPASYGIAITIMGHPDGGDSALIKSGVLIFLSGAFLILGDHFETRGKHDKAVDDRGR